MLGGSKKGSVRRERELYPSSKIRKPQESGGMHVQVCREAFLSQTCNWTEGWLLGESLTERRRKRWLRWLRASCPRKIPAELSATSSVLEGKTPSCQSQGRADAAALCFATLRSCRLGMLPHTEMLLFCIFPRPAESSRAEHWGKLG